MRRGGREYRGVEGGDATAAQGVEESGRVGLGGRGRGDAGQHTQTVQGTKETER